MFEGLPAPIEVPKKEKKVKKSDTVNIQYPDTTKMKKIDPQLAYNDWVDVCTTHIRTCEGDMKVICLVLHQQLIRYKEMLSEIEAEGKQHFNLSFQIERIEKILKSLCEQMNYNIDKVIEQCAKKRETKADNDIGEDALVLSAKVKEGALKLYMVYRKKEQFDSYVETEVEVIARDLNYDAAKILARKLNDEDETICYNPSGYKQELYCACNQEFFDECRYREVDIVKHTNGKILAGQMML